MGLMGKMPLFSLLPRSSFVDIFSDMLDVWFECVQVCCAYTGMMFEVKIEADSNDINQCLHDDKPTIGMFGYSLHLV